MELTEGQQAALRNLARKKAGEEVNWIAIADARVLTDMGLAERENGGWRITGKGEAMLSQQAAGPADPKVVQMHAPWKGA